ncbi:hypothetical protein [Microcoleus sp. BROC3]|uniref:hypothetical protein n=1 Tax=Microcoleus sp. BROC3 TaxID=3055323 RepID=UPI002FD60AD5
MHYTLDELKQKSLKELKEIGHQLNVLPEGDKRCRQNWIEAIVGINPPLMQLLEASPAAEVEEAQEPLEPVTETTPNAFDVEEFRQTHDAEIESYFQSFIEPQVQEPIESKFGRIVYPKPAAKPIAQTVENSPGVNCPHPKKNPYPAYTYKLVREPENALGYSGWLRTLPFPQLKKFAAERNAFSESENPQDWIEVLLSLWKDSDSCINPPLVDSEGFALGWVVNTDEDFKNYTEADSPPNRGDNGRDRLENESRTSQSAIAPATKNSPGVTRKTSTAHQLLELFKSAAHIIPDSPADEEVTESAIGQTESDQIPDLNPILTGCTLSAEFLARYSPPQPEIFHFQSDASGQLSLLDFDVERSDEPPDPDDFKSLDAFREAMALWDAKNTETLTVSNDSMCEWAPCPQEWYEPEAPNSPIKASSMRESSSCNFSIPTFDAWRDRPQRRTDSDEPPDTGIFARLPKPKPPSFPPVTAGKYDRANSVKKFARSATVLSGRAPPGGDAM